MGKTNKDFLSGKSEGTVEEEQKDSVWAYGKGNIKFGEIGGINWNQTDAECPKALQGTLISGIVCSNMNRTPQGGRGAY